MAHASARCDARRIVAMASRASRVDASSSASSSSSSSSSSLARKVHRVEKSFGRRVDETPGARRERDDEGVHQGFRARASFGVSRDDDGEVTLVTVSSDGTLTPAPPFADGVEGVTNGARAVLRAVNDGGGIRFRESLLAVNVLSNRIGSEIVVGCAAAPSAREADMDAFARAVFGNESRVVGCAFRRKKRSKYVVGREFVTETMRIDREGDQRILRFAHVEGSFSNPNPAVAEATANFLCDVCAREFVGTARTRFIELFAGCGNHTVALAPYFPDGATAVEIDEALARAATENFIRNGVENGARAVCAPAEEWIPANVNTVDRARTVLLVDPPRAGLGFDRRLLDVVSRSFDAVIYVACDHAILLRDSEEADIGFYARGFTLKTLACFDHAPTSERWIETVAILTK